MPRRAPNLVRWSPAGQVYDMQVDGDRGSESPVDGDRGSESPPPDSGAWFDWLGGIASFSFQSRSGAHCTVRKEKPQRGGAYWYGYRSRQGRTIKRYIGRTADLSLARLEQVADDLDGH